MMENAFEEHLEGAAQCYMIGISSIRSLICPCSPTGLLLAKRTGVSST